MMHTWADFHFLHPPYLWLLLLVPILLAWLARHASATTSLARLVDKALLPFVVDTRGPRRRWPLALVALAGVLVTLALAGPTWQRLQQPVFASQSVQIVALSLSPRMLATDVEPNRLARARYKVHDLLAANDGGQNALVAYAGDAFTVAPLTRDAGALTDLLDALSPDVMPVPGNNAAAAITRGVKLMQGAGEASGSLVLVTDDAGSKAVDAARRARAAGLRVSVLGVGSTKGSPVRADGGFLKDAEGNIVMARRNDADLDALAVAGGGRYVPMRADQADIDALAAQLRSGKGARVAGDARVAQWRDMGPWLLLPLLVLGALAFRRGWVLLVLLTVTLPLWPVAAYANAAQTTASSSTTNPEAPAHGATWQAAKSPLQSTWNRLWRTPDQRAARALAKGDAARAQALAQDPALRGAAAYRAGDFAAAGKAFATNPGSDAQYNLGNALAKQGHYQQALAAYARALKADPGNTDAKANREAIKAWLAQQQQHRSQSPDASGQGSGQQGQASADGKGATGKSGQHDGEHKGQGKTSPGASQQGSGNKAPQPRKRGPARSGSTSTAPSPSTPAPASSSANSHGQTRPAHAGSAGDQPVAAAAEERMRRKAQAEQARKAVKQQMDKQLGAKHRAGQAYALGEQPASSASSGKALPQAMQQQLLRVQDDPGGLLRRKFMLEYQRRHGVSEEGGPT